MSLNKIIFACLIILLIIPAIHASVADLSFVVETDGLVKVSGYTDFPEVVLPNQTYAYTLKDSDFWYFDINYPVFEKFYFSVVLPKNYKVDNLSTNNNYSITSSNNKITVTGYGLNESLNINLKYSKDPNINHNTNYLIYLFGVLLLLLISIYSYLFIINNEFKKTKPDLTYKNINQRQKQILDILIKEKEVSQNKLLKTLKIPKSSLSRNISSLESKGYIEKKKSGLTFILKLKE